MEISSTMKQEQQPRPTSYQEVQEALRLTEQKTRLTAFISFYFLFCLFVFFVLGGSGEYSQENGSKKAKCCSLEKHGI